MMPSEVSRIICVHGSLTLHEHGVPYLEPMPKTEQTVLPETRAGLFEDNARSRDEAV